MNRFGCLLIVASTMWPAVAADEGQTRSVNDPERLQAWLENMVWHHGFTTDEVMQVTGLTADEVAAALDEFKIRPDNRPERDQHKLLALPYPGGRHPRQGFLDGAINPQRETKLSVFSPWDDTSYAVLDIPEAIWSNLGLTYLAHTHIDTIWTKQNIDLPQHEWLALQDGSFLTRRRLPNGIEFGTLVKPAGMRSLTMTMWLTNGTDEPLSDLRVQNCVLLKQMQGFHQQSKTNKQFHGEYAGVHNEEQSRWLITAWTPLHRAWANPPCPCLHSDPQFPDCAPGETQFVRGVFSFAEGNNLQLAVEHLESKIDWKQQPAARISGNVLGRVIDDKTGDELPCRVYLRQIETDEWQFVDAVYEKQTAVIYDKQRGNRGSVEKHTTLSHGAFQANLSPGRYVVQAVRGKEFVPAEEVIEVKAGVPLTEVTLRLKRFVNMAELGWYSGDTHNHRTVEETPNVLLAEDLNVSLPLSYWVRDSSEVPAASGPPLEAKPDYVDDTHVLFPVNTEYEIFTVNQRRHTQGAVFVLNHKKPLTIPAPPVRPIAEEARRQKAILDLDKHSWNWSLMIIPIMDVDLFELSNNHHWRTTFGFPQWTYDTAPKGWEEIETTEDGFTENGWTEFGLQTYYTLLNCGFHMRVTAGTASGVHPVPLGYGRVYVHCGDRFRYEDWIENLNAGHSYVTQGPLLDLRFDNALPGTRWKKDEVENVVRVTGRVYSRHPLKSAAIVHNGKQIPLKLEAFRTPEGMYSYEVDHERRTEGSAWLAFRCFEDAPNEKVSFAHTNPVFVEVAGHPIPPRKDRIAYFVQRMDEEIERNRGILSDEALAEFEEAKQIYLDLQRNAE